MRLVSQLTLSASLALGGLVFVASALAAPPSSNVYVGDYAGQQVITFDLNGNPVPGGDIHPGSGAEGIGGTNTALAVALSNATIAVYDTTGGGVPTYQRSFSSIDNAFRIAFSQNGQTLYAAEGGNLRSFNFATGSLLNTISLSSPASDSGGSWGIAGNKAGDLLFTTGWFGNGPGGIFKADFANQTYSQVAPVVGAGQGGYVGITFNKAGDKFYAIRGGNNGGGNQNTGYNHIDEFSWDGTTATKIATFDTVDGDPDTNPSYNYNADPLKNAFDTEVGPDGNLYVTSQQGACAVKFNLDGNGDYAGTYSIFIAAHDGGLQQAKTIHFVANNVPGVPEPGAMAFGLISSLGLLGMALKNRKKA